MPVVSVSGKAVVETGSFVMGKDDATAHLVLASVPIRIQFDDSAQGISAAMGATEVVITLPPLGSGAIAALRGTWGPSGGKQHTMSFRVEGEGDPGVLQTHLVTYTVADI